MENVLPVVGWTCFALAALVGFLNFYLSFLRYPLFKLLGREYKWMSGLPGIGTVLLVVSVLCVQDAPLLWGCLVVAVIDTGGLPWFAVMVAWMAMRRSDDRA